MQSPCGILKGSIIAVALSVSLAAQQQQPTSAAGQVGSSQDAYQQQRQGNAVGSRTVDQSAADAMNQSNPGVTPEGNTNAASGQRPETNATLQQGGDGDQGFEIGWLGLLGLAGLFGIGRGRKEPETSVRSGDTRH